MVGIGRAESKSQLELEVKMYDKYKVSVPNDVSGDWSVRHFEVSQADAEISAIRGMFSTGRHVPAGQYTGLYFINTVIMSDTPDEIRDHVPFIRRSHGRVLITGLGLGMVTAACLRREEVTSVTVIEKSPDVIRLVASTVQAIAQQEGKELAIIEADCLTWKPPKGEQWDVAWHDIWPNLCTDNLPQMHTLHRKFGRRCPSQMSWGREMLERRARQDKRDRERFSFRWR